MLHGTNLSTASLWWMMLTVWTLLSMIHESVTITVLPPSTVCVEEGRGGGGREGREDEDSPRPPERDTNVPDTNLSMSLNSRFTESATCLQGINNQYSNKPLFADCSHCS